MPARHAPLVANGPVGWKDKAQFDVWQECVRCECGLALHDVQGTLGPGGPTDRTSPPPVCAVCRGQRLRFILIDHQLMEKNTINFVPIN